MVSRWPADRLGGSSGWRHRDIHGRRCRWSPHSAHEFTRRRSRSYLVSRRQPDCVFIRARWEYRDLRDARGRDWPPPGYQRSHGGCEPSVVAGWIDHRLCIRCGRGSGPLCDSSCRWPARAADDGRPRHQRRVALVPGSRVCRDTDGGQGELRYPARADGRSRGTAVAASAGYDGQFSWSSDGRRLAFISDRDGYDAVYVTDVTGAHVRRVTTTASLNPEWEP